MKIYSNPMSPNSKRVLVCANELGLSPEVVAVDLRKGEGQAADYLARNPMGKVPTLEDDDGYVLWESPAILIYLTSRYPSRGLLPTDSRAHAEVMRWMFWNASHLEPALHGL